MIDISEAAKIVSWVLRGSSDVHHSLSPVIKLGIRHPTKKERKTSTCPMDGTLSTADSSFDQQVRLLLTELLLLPTPLLWTEILLLLSALVGPAWLL